jgi:hypothetical protein
MVKEIGELQLEVRRHALAALNDSDDGFVQELTHRRESGHGLSAQDEARYRRIIAEIETATLQIQELNERVAVLAVELAAISVAMVDRCQYEPEFRSEIAAMRDRVLSQFPHAESQFWMRKWEYDRELPELGFDEVGCLQLEARWKNRKH